MRAGLIDVPSRRRWSSGAAQPELAEAPPRLDDATLLGRLLGRPLASAADWQAARLRHAELLASGRDMPLWPQALRQHICLGDPLFVERVQAAARQQTLQPGPKGDHARAGSGDGASPGLSQYSANIPRQQERPPWPLQHRGMRGRPARKR